MKTRVPKRQLKRFRELQDYRDGSAGALDLGQLYTRLHHIAAEADAIQRQLDAFQEHLAVISEQVEKLKTSTKRVRQFVTDSVLKAPYSGEEEVEV